MVFALLSILPLVQAAEPAPWTTLPSDSEGSYAFRLLEPGTDGDRRRVAMKVTPLPGNRGWTSGELVYDLACAAQTLTVLSVRSFDAEGLELQRVPVPEELRKAEPIHADGGVVATIYSELCPDGPPLPPPPPPPPPTRIVPTPRR